MTGIDIAIRCDRSIFRACTAAGDALAQAGTALHIDHKMEEIEPSPMLALIQIIIGQLVIFGENPFQMFFQYAVWALGRQNDGLKRKLTEALVQQRLYILRKIEIVSGEGAADIMLLVPSIRYELLCFFQNEVI